MHRRAPFMTSSLLLAADGVRERRKVPRIQYGVLEVKRMIVVM